MKRALVVGFVALACTTGCTFPDVDYALAFGEGGLSDASAGDGQASDARSDGSDLAGDGGDGGKEDAAPDPCDFDGDGYKTDAGACGAHVDAGQIDCDDHDARRNPGVNMFQTYPTTNGDWNCNTVVQKQFPINVNCSGILAQAACNVATGFPGDPACGASASYVTCVWNLVALPPLCAAGTTTSQTQGCQ